MKLPLLESTSEVPTRIPMRVGQSLASEGDLAAMTQATGALPRQLPNTMLPLDYGSQPLESMARLAATGAAVTASTSGLLLEAEGKRREADVITKGTSLYNAAARTMDGAIEHLKVSTDHETLRPGYYAAWEGVMQETLGAAEGNPALQHFLKTKLDGLRSVTQKEINTVWRQKYETFHAAAFAQNVDTGVTLATEAATPEEHDFQMKSLESTFLNAAKAGTVPLTVIQSEREKALRSVGVDRAKSEAFLAPVTMLERIAAGDPELKKLGTKETRSLAEYAEGRVRTLRSDVENADARKRRETAEAQNDATMEWRKKVTETHGTGRPGPDLTMEINQAARTLGEQGHKEILEMERVYRERAAKPAPAITSDKITVGTITTAFREGKVAEYSNQDLLRLMENNVLDEGDHRYLTGLRAQVIEQKKAEGSKAKTDAEEIRKQQVKDAKDTIKELLERGNRMTGDTASKTSGILAQDAINEFDQRLAKDPTAIPSDIATEVIVGRIEKAEKLGPALPYKTKEEVAEAYKAGTISKTTATRYYRMLEALEKAKPATTEAPMPKPKGLLERVFGSSEESPVREPVK